MVLEDLDSYMQKKKKKLPQLTSYTKINSRWIKYFSCNVIKFLIENVGRKISDIPHSNIFTNISSRARDIKERINKLDFIKLKSFCTAKENISKMKRDPTLWENIFANDTSEKGLISKIYKELIQLHSRKTNNPIKKGANLKSNLKCPEQTFLQGGHTEGSETYERMLSSTSHQRDANEKHSEIPHHTGQSGYHKQINKQQLLDQLHQDKEMWPR